MQNHQQYLDLMHDIAFGRASWRNLVHLLHQAYPDAVFGLIACQARNRTVIVHQAAAGYSQDALESYDKYYRFINPWANTHQAQGALARVYTTRDKVASPVQESLLNTEFYVDWIKPNNDIREGVALNMGDVGGSTVVLTANIPFRAADELMQSIAQDFTALAKPVAMALQATYLTERAISERSLVQAILAECDAAVFLLDQNALVSELNPAARKLLDQRDGLVLNTQTALCFSDSNADKELNTQLENGRIGRFPGEPFRVPRLHSNPLTAMLIPARRDSVAGELVGKQLFFLFVFDPWSEFSVVPEARIALGLGLSRGEARVARGLAIGNSIEDLAEAIDVSRNTVRNQISAILQKTGASKQADIIRLVRRLRL